MLGKIKSTLAQNGFDSLESVLVALSGGADSVALAYSMWKLSQEKEFKLYFAHVNHGLRGDDADRDEEFCRGFAKRLRVELFVLNTDVRKIAQENAISEEMAGRKARYDFFEELMDRENIQYTVTAHHKNDNAETILLNFLRGSSLAGLRGIPFNRDRYIRPLLGVTRDEIEDFCKSNGLLYVTDKTNNETEYTRNKLRNILIPKLKEYNPNFVDVVTSNAQIIALEDEYLRDVTNKEFQKLVSGNEIETTEIIKLPKAIALRLIRKMITNVTEITDISQERILEVYNLAVKNKTGLVIEIKDNIIARTQYNKLLICEKKDSIADFCYELIVGVPTYIKELGYTVKLDRATEKQDDNSQYFTIPKGQVKIEFRNRREGDVFYPAGMRGSKKLKDYMVNEKIPSNKRKGIAILTFNNEIAWIVGYRRDERFMFRGEGIKLTIS